MRGLQMGSLRTACSHSRGLYTQGKYSSKQDDWKCYSRDVFAVPMANMPSGGLVLDQGH